MFETRKEGIDQTYIFGDIIEEGRFGYIRKAKNKKTNARVVIKELDKEIANISPTRQDAMNKLVREVKIMKLCSHPYIVKYLDCYEDAHKIYIVMEYVRHKDLQYYIESQNRKGKKITEDDARLIFVQLISALEYCHGNLIAHRDIKPENILLESKHPVKIKLTDFGLANYIKIEALNSTFCGTLFYAAPEILMGKDYNSIKVDIWSSGVVLYMLVAGFLPWLSILTKDIPDKEEVAMEITSCNFHRLSFFSPQLTDLLERIFQPANTRITLPEIKDHPWIQNQYLPTYLPTRKPLDSLNFIFVDKIISLGFTEQEVLMSLYKNRNNQIVAIYHNLLDKYQNMDDNVDEKISNNLKLIESKKKNFSISVPNIENTEKKVEKKNKKYSPRSPRHFRKIINDKIFSKPKKLVLQDSTSQTDLISTNYESDISSEYETDVDIIPIQTNLRSSKQTPTTPRTSTSSNDSPKFPGKNSNDSTKLNGKNSNDSTKLNGKNSNDMPKLNGRISGNLNDVSTKTSPRTIPHSPRASASATTNAIVFSPLKLSGLKSSSEDIVTVTPRTLNITKNITITLKRKSDSVSETVISSLSTSVTE